MPIMARPESGFFGQILENLGYTFVLARRLQNLIAQYETPPATRSRRAGRVAPRVPRHRPTG